MNERRNHAFVLVAMAAPLAQVAGGLHWVTVLLICCGGVVLSAACRFLPEAVIPKWLVPVLLGYFAVLAAYYARWTGACWPEQQSSWVIPLALLALSGAVSTGVSRAGRACSVLLFFLAGLFGAVLFAGAKDVAPKWLQPQLPQWDPALALILLLPLLRNFGGEKQGKGWYLVAIPVFAVGISLLCSGVLSYDAAKDQTFAFYETSRSLSLFGVIERFESVVAAAMTLGYFCTLSYIMSFAAEAAEILYPGLRRWGGRGCAAAAALLCLLPLEYLPEGLLLVGFALFGLLPVGLLWAEKINRKKEKKSP